MECPCDKCLKYVICNNKTTVYCDDFANYVNYLQTKINPYAKHELYWQTINKALKKVRIVYRDRGNNYSDVVNNL